MMSQFGKCNVCASPCTSCIRLGPEHLPTRSMSGCFLDEACKHKVPCEQSSQSASASSLKCDEGNLESKFDENSCLGGAGPSFLVQHHRTDKDKKNEAVGSVVVTQRAPQAFNLEPASCCLVDYHSEVDDESHCSGSTKNLRKDASDGNVKISVAPDSNGLEHFYVGPTSVKGHFYHCSMDNTESSCSVTMVSTANEDLKQDAVNSAKPINLAEYTSNKSLCCSNYHEDRTVEQPSTELHSQFSEFVGCDDESALLDDVKVCDICGDAGREDLLAVCSKCNDGAEHTYCMRTRLDKVPNSNWMCEECVLLEEKGKMARTKVETYQKYKSSSQSYQGDEISKGSDVNILRDVICKGLDIDKSSGDKVSLLPSAGRTSGNVTSAVMTKGIALGTISGQPLISRESKAPQAQELAKRSRDESSVPNELSSRARNIQKNLSLSTTSGQDLPKSCLLPMATGNIMKSKSFNDSHKRPKVLRLDEIPRNQFLGETRNMKKGSISRRLGKSLSFNDASSGRSNAFCTKDKRIPPRFSENGDFKRLRYMKEHNSVEMTANSQFKKPQVGPAKDGLFVSALSCEKEFASHGGIILPGVCGTRNHDPKAVQNSRDSAIAGEVKKCSPVADVVQNLLSPPGSDASNEGKSKGEAISHFSLKSGIPRSSDAIGEDIMTTKTDGIGGDIMTTKRTSFNEIEKGPQTSNFSLNSDISNRTGAESHGRSGSLGHASHSQLEGSSLVSDLYIAMMKDTNGSSQTDTGLPFCNQINAYRTLAVPLCNYIWKGEFEIQNNGRLPRVSYRIQAHLSSRASSRIPGAVNKFSDIILLEEVPRLNAWPTQFQEFYPQDDSIGLYFFAEDIRSYGNYKSLLHCLVDYDLALRGNFNGIELLIFSSHLLPESSKYWNGLLFLWGVFKERKANGS